MAYYLHHTITFNNRITENIVIELYKKDVVPSTVIPIQGLYCNKQFLSGEGDKFDPIITSELIIGITINASDDNNFTDFLVSFPDEWKVVLKNDSQIDFVGFLTPNDCKCQFRDKPYDLELSATDCLAYLKSIPLTDYNGNKFSATTSFIDYIYSTLVKTGLDLNIRIYCNIYEGTMIDRNADPNKDAFSQSYVDYRTFLTDATTFTDCFNALTIILKEGFSLFQWFGRWVIVRIGEMQGSIGPKNWYTEYDKQGNVLESKQDLTDHALIGKNQILHPIEANQTILSRFAIKSTKTSYKYDTWPEIPKNNKFDRGSIILGLGGYNPADQTTSVAYTIDDWPYGYVNIRELPLPTIQSTPNRFYRLSTYNIYGVEVEREIIGETMNTDSDHEFWMQSEGLPVNQGDKVSVGIQVKSDRNFNSSGAFTVPVGVILIGDDGNQYMLDNNNNGSSTTAWGFWRKVLTGIGPRLAVLYAGGQDTTEWNSLSCDSLAIPTSGTIYILIPALGPISNTGPRWHFKDLSFDYHAFVAGGYIPVDGDHWFSQTNTNFKDIIEEEVFVSDSPSKLFKGAILNNLYKLTGRTWHRLNVVENKDFKEFINLARYNGTYRRVWQINGTFGGTMYHPSNNQTIRMPLGFHRHFAFKDSSELAGYYFMLVPPLTIDYVSGSIDATFVDCYQGGSQDGNATIDLHEYKYDFKT